MSKKCTNVKNQLYQLLNEQGRSSASSVQQQNSTSGMIYSCILCKSPASSFCQRCGECYCSFECQREDYPHHRHKCFRMPALVPMETLQLNSADFSAMLHDLVKITPEKYQQEPDSKLKMSRAMAKEITLNGNKDIMPLDKKTPELKSIEMPVAETIQNHSCVILTSFQFANLAFVRSFATEEGELFNNAKREIEKAAQNAEVVDYSEIQVGKHVLVKQGGSMDRGRICKLVNIMVNVTLYDSGYRVSRRRNEIYEMPSELLQFPPFAVPVHISKVERVINPKLRDFLSKYLKKKFMLTYTDRVDTPNHVVLFDWETKQSLNDEIIKFCETEKKQLHNNGFNNSSTAAASATQKNHHPSFKKAVDNSKNDVVAGSTPNSETNSEKVKEKSGLNVQTVQKRKYDRHNGEVAVDSKASNQTCMKNPYFEYVLFPVHATNVEAIVVDTSCLTLGYIGCIATSNMCHLQDVQKFLLGHKDDIPYKPSVDEIVIAKYENEWYRAKILDIEPHGTNCTVLYVDFTNVEDVKCDNIRRYPIELTTPCYTNLCLINGLPDRMSSPQLKFLQGEIQDNSTIKFELIKQILDLGQQSMLVQYDCVLKKMKNAGLC